MVKFGAAAAAVVLTFWGMESISDALTLPYTPWLTAVAGVLYLLGALAIVIWFMVGGSKRLH
jgi:hypothetical protein